MSVLVRSRFFSLPLGGYRHFLLFSSLLLHFLPKKNAQRIGKMSNSADEIATTSTHLLLAPTKHCEQTDPLLPC